MEVGSPPSRPCRCVRWRCRRTAEAAVRRQHARQPPRDLPRRRHGTLTAAGSVVVGLEPVARRGAQQTRGLGRQPPLRLGEHRPRRRRRVAARARARCSSATSRATSSSPARDRSRASSPPRTAGRTRGDPVRSADRRRRPRRRLGLRRQQPRRRRRRHAPDQADASSPTRRARSPSRPTAATVYAAAFLSGNQTTVGLAVRGPDGVPRRHARPGDHHDRRRRPMTIPQPPTGLIVKFKQRPLVRRVRQGLRPVRARSSCPTTTSSPSTRPPIRRRPSRDRRLRARRHDAVQHGGQPVERQGLRHQHRRAQRRPLRGPQRRLHDGARPHRRQPHHRHRSGGEHGHAAQPQHAHRLRRTKATRPRRRSASRSRRTSRSRATARRCTSSRRARRKLAIYDTADLEAGNRHARASPTRWCSRAAAPPASRSTRRDGRAYVLTRFDNSISIVDTEQQAARVGKVDDVQPRAGERHQRPQVPLRREPDLAARRRPRARAATSAATRTSWRGTSATRAASRCRSPQLGQTASSTHSDAARSSRRCSPTFAPTSSRYNMPLKGPMTTQSLRGMDNHGAMHWRGDRNGAIQQNGAPFIDPATNARRLAAAERAASSTR